MELNFLINSLGKGGAEKVLFELSKYLKPSNVFVLENTIYYKPYGRTIILADFSLFNNPLVKTLYIPIYANKLKQYLNKNSIVISFMERANFVNILSKSNHKKIIAVRTSLFARPKFHPYMWLMKKLYPKSDLIIANSKALKFSLLNFLQIEDTKIKVLYNPVNIEEISQKAKNDLGRYNFIKSYPYLITVGRLTKAKGQWYLLRIFKHLRDKHKYLKLLILGEGKLKNYLVELSENLGLKTYVWNRDKLNKTYDVYFLGFQTDPYKFIKHSKLFVFTSLWEGFPNVLIETLAVGKTIVSTDCRTGPGEILAPKTDFLLEAKEPLMEEFGILMPNFDRKLLKANEPLTQQEKIWIDFLNWLLDNENLLKDYERKASLRAKDFEIEKIIKQWKEVINYF